MDREEQQSHRPVNVPVVPVNGKGFNRGMVVNVILFLGLIALYAVHFLGPGDEDAADGRQEQVALVERKIDEAFNAMAYVDNDVLMEEYLFAIDLRAGFEEEQRRLENDLDRRQRNFQRDIERFQRDIQSGNIGMEQAQLREQELMQQQQDLIQLNETYRDRLATKEFEMNSDLLDRISEFLERYNREKDYDFILGYARGGGILYARDAHNITAEVLEQLNAEYVADR